MADSSSSVLNLAAQIVSAHVANNKVALDQLPALIASVHRALLSVGQVKTEELQAEPAVLAKRSVFGDHIVCLDCGKQFSMLKKHLKTDHELTPELYRRKWQLPASYPLVAPNYAKTRSAIAKQFGLGRMRLGPKSARTKARQT
jgi:predicted transcriptional regulator